MVGLFPASGKNEDVDVKVKEEGKNNTLYFLRQQSKNKDGFALSLADYVVENDTVGLFVASAGKGIDALSWEYKDQGDDYHALLVAMIADRLAEALSEYLESVVVKDWW